MVDLIEFGRSATRVSGIQRIDVIGVSLGIILAEFFGGVAALVTAFFDALIAPVRGVGEFAGGLVDVIVTFQVPVISGAAEATAAAIDANPSIALLVGIGVVLTTVFVIAQAVSRL